MSTAFVRAEIDAGDLDASRFGSEWRIADAEITRYLRAKGFPVPDR